MDLFTYYQSRICKNVFGEHLPTEHKRVTDYIARHRSFNVNVLFTLLIVYSLNINNDLPHSHSKSWHFLKVQPCKLYNNKYMMA